MQDDSVLAYAGQPYDLAASGYTKADNRMATRLHDCKEKRTAQDIRFCPDAHAMSGAKENAWLVCRIVIPKTIPTKEE